MTTPKITAFLKRPATAAGALGGTPKAFGLGGGRFRKAPEPEGQEQSGVWVHVHEAALEGLAVPHVEACLKAAMRDDRPARVLGVKKRG